MMTYARKIGRSSGWLYVVAIGSMVLAWKLAVLALKVPQYLVPAPEDVLIETIRTADVVFFHTQASFYAVAAGFLIAFALGLPTGMAIAFSRTVDRFASPILITSQAIPKVALAPVFAVWFGLGIQSIIAIAAAIAFFPIVINVALGFKGINPDLVRLGRSMGGSPWQLFVKIRLPDASPSLFVALKLGVLFSVIGVVVGEFVMGSQGLGYWIALQSGALRTASAFGGIVLISLMAVGLYLAVDIVERYFLKWHPSQSQLLTA